MRENVLQNYVIFGPIFGHFLMGTGSPPTQIPSTCKGRKSRKFHPSARTGPKSAPPLRKHWVNLSGNLAQVCTILRSNFCAIFGRTGLGGTKIHPSARWKNPSIRQGKIESCHTTALIRTWALILIQCIPECANIRRVPISEDWNWITTMEKLEWTFIFHLNSFLFCSQFHFLFANCVTITKSY